MTARSRLAEVDAMKGIAVIGIVAHHSNRAAFGDYGGPLVDSLVTCLEWSVMAFFLSAGYVARRPEATLGVMGLLRQRAVRLLVPCYAFSWAYKIALLALGAAGLLSSAPALPRTPVELAAFVLLPVGPQFYFLIYLFGLEVAYALVPRRVDVRMLILASGLTASFVGFVWGLPSARLAADVRLVPLYVLVFCTGVVLRGEKKSWLWAAAPALGCAVASWSFTPLQVAAAVLGYSVFRVFNQRALVRGIALVGRHSGAVFAWHAPLLLPLLTLVLARPSILGGCVNALVTLSVTTLTAIGLGQLTARVPLLRPWRI